MHKLVVHGAMLQCSMGSAPAKLSVPPTGPAEADAKPIATVMDHRPNVNVAPFAMCKSMANPQVASATAAAMGALTPQPCVPVIPAPWTPGASVATIDGVAALTDDSKCVCAWAGQITVSQPGATQFTTD